MLPASALSQLQTRNSFCVRKPLYAKIVALPTQPAACSGASPPVLRISSRGRTIRPKVNFDSLPHHSAVNSSEIPAAHCFHPVETETAGKSVTSSKMFCNECGSGNESEDDAPIVQAIAAGSRAHASKPANHTAASTDKIALVKRSATRCSHSEKIQRNTTLAERDCLSTPEHPQRHLQPQQRHSNPVKNSNISREPAGAVAASKAASLPELRNLSFIITNVSRCVLSICLSLTTATLPQVLFAHAAPRSENTVDINKGQLDRVGTSKKTLAARAAALGMAAWTAGRICFMNYVLMHLIFFVHTVANVTTSAVLVASCPPPPHLVVMCETVVSASTQMLVALALGVTPLHCSWLSSVSCADSRIALIPQSYVLPLDAIIPKDYSRLSLARSRPACITPLPLEQRVLSGCRLGYYTAAAGSARYRTPHVVPAIASLSCPQNYHGSFFCWSCVDPYRTRLFGDCE